jgi:hypothetical protein
LTKKFFFHVPKEDNRVLKAQKTTFSSRHGFCNILFLPLGELGTCLQNLIYSRGVEHWEKKKIPQGGKLKFTYKGRLLTIKKAYKKMLYWKSKRWEHALVCPLHIGILFLTKLTPKIPWDQKLVDCCLGSLCEEK